MTQEGTRQVVPIGSLSLPGGLGGLVAKLWGVNALLLLLSFASGPILARALGADGRGQLAAILVPLTIAPWLLDFGMGAYVARESARGTNLGVVLGSMAPISLVAPMVVVILSGDIAHAIGQGRPTVEQFLRIGLVFMPVAVICTTAMGALWGQQRWRVHSLIRLFPPAGATAGFVVLLAVGELDLESAAIVSLVTLAVGFLPLVVTLRRVGRWRFDRQISSEGFRFGLKSWLATVASVSNARLDQLLMALVVSSQELGLYAVAVSVAYLTASFISAVATALFPRVAQGDEEVIPRASRISVLLVVLGGFSLAAVSPVAIPFVFGSDFKNAVPMAMVLLVGSVLVAVNQVLGSALAAAGHPDAVMRAQMYALAVSVPALLLVLPSSGGIGASVIATVTNGIAAGVVLRRSTMTWGGGLADYLVPRASDLSWLRFRWRDDR